MAIDRRVQAIFDRAMYLMDAQNESTGATLTGDTRDYQVRTLGILNSLLDLVYPASDTFAIGPEGQRPALPDLTAFTDEVELDPRILREVLPSGLAAKLLSQENPALADYFQQCFEQSLARARATRPAAFEAIDRGAPYGGIEYGALPR